MQALTDEMLTELKSCFLEAYDDNQDGKIDIRELAQLLPMEENFLLLFRFDNPLDSSVEFMKIWREYDSDNSGYIEADELKVRSVDGNFVTLPLNLIKFAEFPSRSLERSQKE